MTGRTGLRLAAALYFLWIGCGETAEGRYWLRRALAADPHPGARRLGPEHPALARAQQHLAVGMLLGGNASRALDLLVEAEQVCRGLGERWWLGLGQLVAAAAALAVGDSARAGRYAGESLRCANALGDILGGGAALEFLASVAVVDHDYRRAARLLGAAGRQ